MSVPIANIPLVQLDRKPFLSFHYEDVDLSDFVTIVLRVRRENNSLIEINATVDDAAGGLFHFEWGADDLTPGIHSAEIVLTDGDGLPMTLPAEGVMRLVVRERA